MTESQVVFGTAEVLLFFLNLTRRGRENIKEQ